MRLCDVGLAYFRIQPAHEIVVGHCRRYRAQVQLPRARLANLDLGAVEIDLEAVSLLDDLEARQRNLVIQKIEVDVFQYRLTLDQLQLSLNPVAQPWHDGEFHAS